MEDAHSNPMIWDLPDPGGIFTVTVEVDDGNGGTASLEISLEVFDLTYANIPYVNAECGEIIEGEGLFEDLGNYIYAGDSDTDRKVRGFMSYDITSLAGKIIDYASLTFVLESLWGDPSSFGNLWVGVVDYGEGPLVIADYNLIGVGIQSFSVPNFICSNQLLIDKLQEAVDAGKTRFQIRIHFTGGDGFPSENGDWDGWEYDCNEIILAVYYFTP